MTKRLSKMYYANQGDVSVAHHSYSTARDFARKCWSNESYTITRVETFLLFKSVVGVKKSNGRKNTKPKL